MLFCAILYRFPAVRPAVKKSAASEPPSTDFRAVIQLAANAASPRTKKARKIEKKMNDKLHFL